MNKPRGTLARALFCAWFVTLPVAAAAQQGAPAPETTVRRIESADISRDSVVRLARAQLGRRYLFGGTSPAGFDCSGFLKYLMRAMGVDLPRTAAQQARVGTEVPRDPRLLRPGDILTFGRGNRVTHVGVYVGDGKYIHASSGAGRIVESRLDRPQSHLVRAWYGVRRLLSDSTTSVAQRADKPNR
ncbi:MAG TPA: C40 family peptidase [Longimicrobium sp.]|nr:C40 family peptidase [Longimicrobium sp.]